MVTRNTLPDCPEEVSISHRLIGDVMYIIWCYAIGIM